MRDFKRQRGRGEKIWRVCLSIGALLALLFVTFFAARGTWGMYQKFSEAATSDAEAQQQLALLQAQEVQVSGQVAELNTPLGVETQLRERYGVAKPGEGEIEIVTDAPSTTPASAPSQNWFVRAYQALFGWM
jgi:cell division protein FtsB